MIRKEKEKEATIEVRPVAWTDDKVNKYQAFGRFRGKCIPGDPMPTEIGAIESLLKEIDEWNIASREIEREFNNKYSDLNF